MSAERLTLGDLDRVLYLARDGDNAIRAIGGTIFLFPDMATFQAWADEGRRFHAESADRLLAGFHPEPFTQETARLVAKLRLLPVLIVTGPHGKTKVAEAELTTEADA